MSKNIVLLSDGTGNSSSKLFKTNVWRMFQALDLTDASKQVAYYDNGVGTSSFKWWAAFTGIFGIGLKRNNWISIVSAAATTERMTASLASASAEARSLFA